MPARAARVTLHDGLGVRGPVERAERRREDPLEPGKRAQPPRILDSHDAARQSELVLKRDAPLEHGYILGAVEEEEVADLVEVDLGSGALAEACERLEAAKAEQDVQGVRELGSNASGGATRRARRELGALEQADLDPGLGEVERNARSGDAAADDDDLGSCRDAHVPVPGS